MGFRQINEATGEERGGGEKNKHWACLVRREYAHMACQSASASESQIKRYREKLYYFNKTQSFASESAHKHMQIPLKKKKLTQKHGLRTELQQHEVLTEVFV